MRRKIVFSALLLVGVYLASCVSAVGQDRIWTDELGRKVKIPHAPRKIVSLAPSITEILFSLGLSEEIAGVTDFCDFPEAALKKPRIGGFVNPDIEKIVSLKPDLVIAIRDGNRLESVRRLDDLGISVYWCDPKGFDGVIGSVRHLGEVAGRQGESKRIAEEMIRKKETIVSATRALPRPRVFFQMGDNPVVTVGRGTLADELIRLAGGRSISEDEAFAYPVYSIETIIAKAPEIIIMSSMESTRNYSRLVKRWQQWQTLPAVKKNAIHVVDSNLVDRPTPRIVEGLGILAGIIHPEVKRN